MSSLQEKKYIRLIKFSLDISLKVSRAFTTSNVLHNYNNSLAVFLTTHQHDIYHLWIPDSQCCCCTVAISLKSKQLLYKPQFDKMFIMTGQINHGHVKKHKSNKNHQVTQHCVCNIAPNPTCTLDKLDIVILCRIVRHCFKLQPDEKLWLDTISKIRNELAHVENISNFENGTLEHWWTQLEGSVLGLSRKVPPDLYYHEAIQGQVSLLQMLDLESSGAQEILDKLKSDNAKLMADMKDGLNYWYVTQESFEILENAVIASKNETEAQLRHLMNGQEAAASQASHLQNMIVNENNNMKEVQERQFQSFKESQSEIKREVSEFKGEMNSRMNRLEIMVQAILQKQQMSSPEAADGVGRTHDVGCKAHGGDIDYDKVITELQNEEPIDDEARAFKINSASIGSILLDLTCSPEVLKSEANLRAAILNLVDRIVKAGNIDTNVPGTMNIGLTFKGPLTEEEARVLSTVFSTKEDNQEVIVIAKKAEEIHAGNDENVADASSLDKPIENMVYCKNCDACFVCDNCDLKDRQILDLMEIKSQEKKKKYDYESRRKDKQFHTVENKYTDWMKLHLKNLQKEEQTLERDVANCGSLRSRMSEEIEQDKTSRCVNLEKEKVLNTLHTRYSNICNQLETKAQQVKYHQFALDEYLSKEVEKDDADEIDFYQERTPY